MALSSAWCSVLRLWLLWGAAGSRAAQGDNAFPFDIEGSSAVGRQDPPETSERRVAPGRPPPPAEVQCSCHCHPAGHLRPAGCVRRARPCPPPSPASFPPWFALSFTWIRSVQKLEIKSLLLKLDLGVVS
uniref:Laminin subunit alpha 4 n=1 Tax=Molossus molossus TaxID=27622 RepID=A0A7J8GQE8_MOLMO|nr:laminin subunit alpha 4 [Molossus molossus]